MGLGLASGLWSEVLRAALLAAARARGELGRSVVERHLARLNSRQERVSFTIVIVPQQDVRGVHEARRGPRHHQTMPRETARSSDLRSRRRQHEGGREESDDPENHGTAPCWPIQLQFLRCYTHNRATSHTADSTTRGYTTLAHTATRRCGPPAARGMIIRVLKAHVCARRAAGS